MRSFVFSSMTLLQRFQHHTVLQKIQVSNAPMHDLRSLENVPKVTPSVVGSSQVTSRATT